MRPIKFEAADTVYRGPTDEIGDLWCLRERPGVITSVWEPDEDERALLAAGGRLMLTLHSEPIPPIAMSVLPEQQCRPVGEHPWKVERNNGAG